MKVRLDVVRSKGRVVKRRWKGKKVTRQKGRVRVEKRLRSELEEAMQAFNERQTTLLKGIVREIKAIQKRLDALEVGKSAGLIT